MKLIDVPGAYDIPGAVARNLKNEDGTLLKSFASIFVSKKYYKKNKSDLELKRLLNQLVLGS